MGSCGRHRFKIKKSLWPAGDLTVGTDPLETQKSLKDAHIPPTKRHTPDTLAMFRSEEVPPYLLFVLQDTSLFGLSS